MSYNPNHRQNEHCAKLRGKSTGTEGEFAVDARDACKAMIGPRQPVMITLPDGREVIGRAQSAHRTDDGTIIVMLAIATGSDADALRDGTEHLYRDDYNADDYSDDGQQRQPFEFGYADGSNGRPPVDYAASIGELD